MARRPNYGYEKRQRELKKQKKKAEKAERRRLKKEAADGGDESGTAPRGGDDLALEGDDATNDELVGPEG